MIRNFREYRIAKSKAVTMRAALAGAGPSGLSTKTLERHRLGVQTKLAALEAAIKSFDDLESGQHGGLFRGELSDLGDMLIRARIARGWSQRELGEKLGLHMQKVQQYEASGYASASLTRILQVWQALGVITDVGIRLLEPPSGHTRPRRTGG